MFFEQKHSDEFLLFPSRAVFACSRRAFTCLKFLPHSKQFHANQINFAFNMRDEERKKLVRLEKCKLWMSICKNPVRATTTRWFTSPSLEFSFVRWRAHSNRKFLRFSHRCYREKVGDFQAAVDDVNLTFSCIEEKHHPVTHKHLKTFRHDKLEIYL